MRKRKTVMMVIGVIALLLAILGATYAYFSVNISGNESASSVIIGTARLELTYDSGDTIVGNKILPGWSATKTFTVENNSTIPVYYAINWVNITNSFTNVDDLVYELSGDYPKSETTAPSTSEVILEGLEIGVGEIHTYTLTITFKNQPSEQNEDQGASFMGKIQITESTAPVAPEE